VLLGDEGFDPNHGPSVFGDHLLLWDAWKLVPPLMEVGMRKLRCAAGRKESPEP